MFNDGSDLWLSRGFHRYHAAVCAGWDKIEAESVQGTRRDAILDALGDNATHGVRRTNADKEKAVTTLLEDGEWCKWSDTKIAERCCVSVPTVGKYRSLLKVNSDNSERTYTTKHGTQAVMNTENIGKAQMREPGSFNEDRARHTPIKFKHPNADGGVVCGGGFDTIFASWHYMVKSLMNFCQTRPVPMSMEKYTPIVPINVAFVRAWLSFRWETWTGGLVIFMSVMPKNWGNMGTGI